MIYPAYTTGSDVRHLAVSTQHCKQHFGCLWKSQSDQGFAHSNLLIPATSIAMANAKEPRNIQATATTAPTVTDVFAYELNNADSPASEKIANGIPLPAQTRYRSADADCGSGFSIRSPMTLYSSPGNTAHSSSRHSLG